MQGHHGHDEYGGDKEEKTQPDSRWDVSGRKRIHVR